MTTRICFIVHGKIRQQQKLLANVQNTFRGVEIAFRVTAYAKHAIALASTAVTERFTHIVCVGGDGSLNEVVNGIMKSCEENPGLTPPRLALIPKGRGNDFARTMCLASDLESLKKMVDAGSFQKIDLGLARFNSARLGLASRYFINITDIGMGGVIAHKLAGYPMWLGAWLSFQRAIVSTLLNYKPQKIKFQAEGKAAEAEIMNLVIANGKYFGNGMGIAPDASPSDGRLSIVIIGNISLLDYLKLLGDVKKARKLTHPEIKYFTSAEIHIEAMNAGLPIDMDGDFVGYSPLTIQVVPAAIEFIAPQVRS